MPFTRPTLPEIITRKITDFESRLPGATASLRRSVLNALIRASAAVAHGLHGHLDWLARQIITATAAAENLELHANWWGIYRLAATPATGNVTFTGANGSTAPAGTVLQRGDGAQYTTNADATIASGSATVSVTASAAGPTGNADAGVALSLVSPIVGVNSSALVAAGGLSGGTDLETDTALRDRLRARVQQPPHGGASFDYEAWAKEIAGVTRVWVMPLWLGAGTVGVFFVRDNDASIIPDSGEVAAVQAHIDTVRPVTAAVTVIAPTAAAQAITVSISPNTAAVRDAISAELADLFAREANVEDGAGSGTILISHINEAISLAAGEFDHAVTVPAGNITLTAGQIATLGAITYNAL